MRAPSKTAALAVAFAVALAGPAAVQASFSPDNTNVVGQARPAPDLQFNVFSIRCDTWTLRGRTGARSSALSLTLAISDTTGSCPSSVGYTCTVTTSTWTLRLVNSTEAPNGTIAFALDAPGITANCGRGNCVLTYVPQTLGGTGAYNGATDALRFTNITLRTTLTGPAAPLCSPLPSGSSNWTGSIYFFPAMLTVTNP